MSDIGRFLEQQRQGTLDSEGTFTLDPTKARSKLMKFQLPKENDCWLKFVQAAVAWNASELQVSTGKLSVLFTFHGDLDLGLPERWPALLSNPLGITSGAEQHMALGILASLNKGSKLVWSYEFQGHRQALTVDAHSLALGSSPANGAPASLALTLHRPAELDELFERCRFCPIPLRIDGSSPWRHESPRTPFVMEVFCKKDKVPGISVPGIRSRSLHPSPHLPDMWTVTKSGIWPVQKNPRCWLVECQGMDPSEDPRWLAQTWIQLHDKPSPDPTGEIVLYRDGVSLPPLRVALPINARVVTEEPSLKVDLTGFSVVDDQALQIFLLKTQRNIQSLLATLRLHKDDIPAFPVLGPEPGNGLPRVLGRWLLLEKLAQDWPKEMYRAVPANNRNLWEEVVVSTFPSDDDYYERLIRSRMQLKNPRVPAVIDQGQVAAERFIASPRAFGQPLNSLIPRRGVERDLALRIFHQMCQLAADVSQTDWVMGPGLSPEYLLWDGSEIIWLGPITSEPGRQSQNAWVSSESYMEKASWCVPEQLAGFGESSASAQYRLGLLGFSLFTGRHPFPQNDVMMMLMHHISQEPPDPLELRPEIPKHIAAAIIRCLRKKPEQRYPSLGDLLKAVSAPEGV